jgi:hypothetical protein
MAFWKAWEGEKGFKSGLILYVDTINKGRVTNWRIMVTKRKCCLDTMWWGTSGADEVAGLEVRLGIVAEGRFCCTDRWAGAGAAGAGVWCTEVKAGSFGESVEADPNHRVPSEEHRKVFENCHPSARSAWSSALEVQVCRRGGATCPWDSRTT